MAIALFADTNALIEEVGAVYAAASGGEADLCVLVTHEGSERVAPLQAAVETLIVVDVASGRLNRLNFDAIALLILDLPPDVLLSSGGRRLTDALGRLAEESLVLSFVGLSTATTGAFLADGQTAGLNLIPRTVVIPNVQGVSDLRTLLERTNEMGLRLLALDGSAAALYRHATDQVAVQGEGSALLAAYTAAKDSAKDDATPTARLQVVAAGSQSGWPA